MSSSPTLDDLRHAVVKCGQVLRNAGVRWWKHKHSDEAAAMAFYSLVSLGPILVAGVLVASLFVDRATAIQQLISETTELAGEGVGQYLAQLLNNQLSMSAGKLPLIGILVLFYSATKVIAKLRDALGKVFGERKKKKGKEAAVYGIISRLMSVAMLLSLGAMIALSVILETLLGLLKSHLDSVSMSLNLFVYVSPLISFLSVVMLTAVILRWLPARPPRFKEALIGGAICAGMLTALKFGLAIYFKHAAVGSLYGGAIALVLVLFWIYFSMQVFLFGAECSAELVSNRIASGGPDDEPENLEETIKEVIEAKQMANGNAREEVTFSSLLSAVKMPEIKLAPKPEPVVEPRLALSPVEAGFSRDFKLPPKRPSAEAEEEEFTEVSKVVIGKPSSANASPQSNVPSAGNAAPTAGASQDRPSVPSHIQMPAVKPAVNKKPVPLEDKKAVERAIAQEERAQQRAAERAAAEQRIHSAKAKEQKLAAEQRAVVEQAAEQRRAAEQRAAVEKAAAQQREAEQRIAEKRAAKQQAEEQRAAEQRAVLEKAAAEQAAAEQHAAAQRAVAEKAAAEQRAAEQHAAEQRAAAEKAAAEQRAAEERAAAQRAAAEKVAAEQRAAEQRAAEKRAAEKRAAAQRAAEQRAAEKAAAEKRAAEKRAEEQRAAEQRAAEKRAAEQRAAEQRAAEQAAAEKAAAEKAAAEQRAAEKRAAEQRAAEQRAAEQRAAEQAAAEQAAAAQAAAEKAAAEQRAAEERAAEQRAAEQRAAEQRAAEQAAAEQRAAEQRAAEQAAAEQAAAEQAAAEQRAAEQRAAEQAAAEQRAAEQRAAEQRAAEQAAAEQAAAEQAAAEQAAAEQRATEQRAAAQRAAEKAVAEQAAAEHAAIEQRAAEQRAAAQAAAEQRAAEPPVDELRAMVERISIKKKTAENKLAQQRAAEKKTGEQETVERESAAAREAAEREVLARESAEREAAARETAARETADREAAEREATEHKVVVEKVTAGLSWEPLAQEVDPDLNEKIIRLVPVKKNEQELAVNDDYDFVQNTAGQDLVNSSLDHQVQIETRTIIMDEEIQNSANKGIGAGEMVSQQDKAAKAMAAQAEAEKIEAELMRQARKKSGTRSILVPKVPRQESVLTTNLTPKPKPKPMVPPRPGLIPGPPQQEQQG
ncbi:YihY/virulence factor BrkB family protein [Persicirhabdus sediminis]|uniref:YihY/virulence factor BrkB family protein n=1 Tax=Persicirhabdus sediminis TaxID=454144 RepID=A0A8J7MF29_9BACT|nr:YihY/virulence factor BrkB family protein [Persicirhabdus sediminis]MBK1792167.1 YihY/virulence factor BrkB family protein [Persicirhabdus sediminis]